MKQTLKLLTCSCIAFLIFTGYRLFTLVSNLIEVSKNPSYNYISPFSIIGIVLSICILVLFVVIIIHIKSIDGDTVDATNIEKYKKLLNYFSCYLLIFSTSVLISAIPWTSRFINKLIKWFYPYRLKHLLWG